MPVQKPQVHSIQKKNHPPLVRQIFEVRASRHWADRLSPATVAIAMPAYSWDETQSHGELLALMFIRYLSTSKAWVIYSSLGQEQYWHGLGSLLCPGYPSGPGHESLRLANTYQQGDWDPDSFATPHYQLPRATLPFYLTAHLMIPNSFENSPFWDDSYLDQWSTFICQRGIKPKWALIAY